MVPLPSVIVKATSLALLLCTAAAACGGRPHTIAIGAAGPWTESYGDMTKKGIEMAVAEVNDSGGVRGQRLELIERDDRGDGARAASIAQEFVSLPEIVAVAGHVTSGAEVAAAKVYDGHLAAVSTSATTPDLTGISPWVFRVISSDSSNGIAIARFAAAMGRKRAAILYENTSYGRGLADSFARAFPGEVVSIDPISPDIKDAEPYISYYRSRAPDIVFVVGVGESGLAVLREAHRQHFAVDFVGGDGWTAIATDTATAEGAYVGTPFTALDPRPEVQRFVTAFRVRYHEMPDAYAALGYDTARLLAQAIQAVGPDRAAVREYLASRVAATAFHGVTGVIWFRDGDPGGSTYRVTRVHDGAFVLAEAHQ